MDLAEYRPTLAEVAKLFGKSSRWISDLRAKGDLPGDGATLAEFVKAWTNTVAGSGTQKPIDKAKARREAAKAEREEILTAQLKNELLQRGQVNEAVHTAFARVRSKALSLPSKLAPRIASMTSAVEIEETLTEHVHEMLAELSSTEVGVEEASARSGDRDLSAPGRFGRDGGDGGDVVAGADATTAAAAEPVGGPEKVPQRRGKRRAG
jgi:hypothetical protein